MKAFKNLLETTDAELTPEYETEVVTCHFTNMVKLLPEKPSAVLRREQLASLSGRMCCLKSHHICLFCLLRSAQHVLSCGHTLCDSCAQIFGTPVAGGEYQFLVKGCLCCLYPRPLLISVLPPTMSASILAIDGGGVRGVIPLEFLTLAAEHLAPCSIQDVVDLAIGTSSGALIALGLFAMSWDVRTCSERFDTLAKRIFSRRRPSILSMLLHRLAGVESRVGGALRSLQWLIQDSCYDSIAFDDALKSVFGEDRQVFSAPDAKDLSLQRSDSKFGVITTSISKDTSTFVYFTPADLQGIGSFQDGGLKYNFAGDIACQIAQQVWPSAVGSLRVLSLGTGKASHLDQTPHFRHVFSDGFMRRGFDAWMSTMNTDADWKKWRNRLTDDSKTDSHRLDAPLESTDSNLDSVESMERLRDLVILQPGSSRMVREAVSTLLVSRFFFLIQSVPEQATCPFWCYGTVRCKGPAREIITALERLHPDGLQYTSQDGYVERFNGVRSICDTCGCYYQPMSFLVPHLDQRVEVFITNTTKKQWRISGFPATVRQMIHRQNFGFSFGRDDHGYPCREDCRSCGKSGIPGGQRRKRRTSLSQSRDLKRVR
ncbi:hypothetical protein N7539_007700 [Penicillium diatomitis]|uniref:PNPLA domain-containing protein n=1 Tax=Penicillium diatomitis TaxID=2819901 RepID=A0A9W9WTX5_9EURO|nr:uncharacterized protein N7539_007700 [Penicillium diatomitis]KAJ5475413.1 hypothetical protein N7539_007700 [Penicillium diatomitis]